MTRRSFHAPALTLALLALPLGCSDEADIARVGVYPEYRCDDGIDNDRNGLADCDDPSCELDFWLTSPDGSVEIRSLAGPGGSPDSPIFISISDFAGQPVAGVWSLEVLDQVAGDTGTFDGGTLAISFQ